MSGGQLEKPVMQVLNSKIVNSNQVDKMRFRLLLSDGLFTISYAMVTTTTEIPDFSIIRINSFITSVINNTGKGAEKRVLVILNYDTLLPGSAVTGKIGNPVALPDMLTIDNMPTLPVSNGAQKATVAVTAPANLNQSSLDTSLINPISSVSPYSNK